MNQGEVRIISGKWRSRKLRFPAIKGLRPSPDRIRETLFNWLAPHIEDRNVLDLFAGSGAFGFESVSRGAKSALFIDESATVIQYLQQQIENFTADNCFAIQASIPFSPHIFNYNKNLQQFLVNNKQLLPLYDLVFLDPPFHDGLIEPTCKWIEEQNWLNPRAIIYLEAEVSLKPLPIPENWEIIRSKSSGQIGYHLLQRT